MKSNQSLRQLIFISTISLAVATGTNATQAADTAKLTATIIGRGTLSPSYKGKALNIGQDYTIKAIATTGFAFSDWLVASPTNTTTNTSARLTFQMVSNLQLTANFLDIQPPTVKITTKAGTGSNSVVTISGTAKDNVGVVSVWCQAGSSGWNLATTSDAYTNWTAVVILSAGANTIQAYAEDAAGNRSPTNSVIVTDDATGFAPESLAGTTLQVVTTNASAVRSFGESTFSQVAIGKAGTGVGTYTYTLIDANTGQLAGAFTAPPANGSNNLGADVSTLSFTNGKSGTWTNTNGVSGSFTLSDASSTAPDSLDGLAVQGVATGTNYQFTNEYGDGTYTTTDNYGNSSGTYTYALYSPTMALVQSIVTSGNDVGTTNYGLMDFLEGSNTYYVESINITNGTSTNTGTFSVIGQTNAESYTAPASLVGLTGMVTQVKTNGTRRSFLISFGASTYGQYSESTNHDGGVGTYTFSRTGSKTAAFLNTYLSPPDVVSNQGPAAPNYFFFTSSHSANFTNVDGHGTVSFSAAASTAPLSLGGRKLAGSHGGKPGGFSFAYGTFNGIGHDITSAGTYTYAIYGPQVAMATLNYTDSKDAGTTQYLELWFSSVAGGNYRQDDGEGNVQTGAFTVE